MLLAQAVHACTPWTNSSFCTVVYLDTQEKNSFPSPCNSKCVYINKHGGSHRRSQDELMQSLDYKLKTSNTSYVTARHDARYFPSLLSSFSPQPLGLPHPADSGTSFIDPESIKIAFRVRGRHQPAGPATPNPACFVQRVQVFANGQRCDDLFYLRGS